MCKQKIYLMLGKRAVASDHISVKVNVWQDIICDPQARSYGDIHDYFARKK